ncbi:MAG: GlmU family protein [Cyclobacteriaceae bacterium]|nr:GlmU family protein [Cyclobacteriaceae bacterium]
MNVILFDDPATRQQLLPFTYTRPIADIRAGILTIKEKWERYLPANYSYLTEPYLSAKFPCQNEADSMYIHGAVLPDNTLIDAVRNLKIDQALFAGDQLIAMRGNASTIMDLMERASHPAIEKISLLVSPRIIQHTWQIFRENGVNIRHDFDLITKGRKSQPITDKYTAVYAPQNIFIEENVTIKSSVLNAENGPIYIGAHCEIGETSVIRGNNAICENSALSIGTQIRGDSTIGPYCKVGGEISNSMIFGYSSKAHEGFLGNSVIGEWCNIGAGTNTSNLKNTYKNIRIWSYATERFEDTGLQFCGLIMGDHSKCGIDTMFNTGTVVGVNANVFGAGFTRAFIPSFSWGGAQGLTTYKLKEALEVMPKVMERRGKILTDADIELYAHIFEMTGKYRPGEAL